MAVNEELDGIKIHVFLDDEIRLSAVVKELKLTLEGRTALGVRLLDYDALAERILKAVDEVEE